MGFPTVKSDPYKKGLKPRRKHLLWSEWFWKQLVAQAKRDFWSRDVSPACVKMISDMNDLLYGSR